MDEEDGQNDDAPAVNRRNSGGVLKQERPEEESSWRALRTVGRPKSALRPPSGPPAGGTEDPFGLHESCPPVRALIKDGAQKQGRAPRRGQSGVRTGRPGAGRKIFVSRLE